MFERRRVSDDELKSRSFLKQGNVMDPHCINGLCCALVINSALSSFMLTFLNHHQQEILQETNNLFVFISCFFEDYHHLSLGCLFSLAYD